MQMTGNRYVRRRRHHVPGVRRDRFPARHFRGGDGFGAWVRWNEDRRLPHGSTIELTGASDTIAGFSNGTLSLAGSDAISLVMGTRFAGSAYSAAPNGESTDITVSCFAVGLWHPDGCRRGPGRGPAAGHARRFAHARARAAGHVGRVAALAGCAGAHRRGAFGEATRIARWTCSPDHAVFVNGELVPVRYLINGFSHRAGRVRRGHVFPRRARRPWCAARRRDAGRRLSRYRQPFAVRRRDGRFPRPVAVRVTSMHTKVFLRRAAPDTFVEFRYCLTRIPGA